MPANRILLCFLLFTCLIPSSAVAATLEITQVSPSFGDVYISSEFGLPMFTVTAKGGDCDVSITPDFDYVDSQWIRQISQPPAPAGHLSSGESATIWVWIYCTIPGDHETHVKFESNCGDAYRTLQFTCLGGYINGTVFDFFTKQPVPTAVVTPANPYTLHITMLGNGAYSGAGNPESHWVWVRADGYKERLVNLALEQAGTLTRDFELVPAPSLGDVIAAIQVLSGFEPSTGHTYHVDINGDGKMGLDDALLLLQLVFEQRQFDPL